MEKSRRAIPLLQVPSSSVQNQEAVKDYYKLNEIKIKDQYPLPLISEILTRVQASKVFMKMDLWWGFNNIHIKDGNE
jgi:hypothetical protein